MVLLISRRKVEAADLASVLSRLKVFLATRADAWLYRGQMTLIVECPALCGRSGQAPLLAIMYAAFRQIDPAMDAAADIDA